MAQNIPSRNELIEKLKSLRSGYESRADIAAWAFSIIDDDLLRVKDKLVWKTLASLGGADLPAPDREFLFTDVDFEEWQSKLESNQ